MKQETAQMNLEMKRTILETARRCFELVGLNYDSPEIRIVPLFDIITAHPIFVKELPPEQRLTARLATDCIQREMGFSVKNYLQKTNKLSGFIYAAQSNEQLFACIFTETSEPTARRRFSAAHELAHYLLDFVPLVKLQPNKFSAFTEGITFNESDDEGNKSHEILFIQDVMGEESHNLEIFSAEYERVADAFAAELLMPRVACLSLAKLYGRKFGKNKNAVVRRLATEFLTSFDAVNRRLKDLEFFDYDSD